MASFFTAQFNGGMNEVVDPALLDTKSAVEMINTTLVSGKISSINLPFYIKSGNPEEFGHYGKRNRSVVKWYERYYWSNNNAVSAPYYGGNEENYLGIPYVDYSKDVGFEKLADGELSGKYKYCVTLVNVNGWEGAPGALTEYEKVLTLENNKVKVTVQWNDERVSYAKVYRTIDHGADFYCVGEIKESGGSLTDAVTDYILAGLEPLSSIDSYPPPEHGKYLCESGGVFFLAVGSTVYFSEVGNPHAWPPLNFVGVDDLITGIAPEFQGVLVFTVNNTYRIVGADSIETMTKTLLPGNQGCVEYNTIAQISNAPVWLSNDGICLWNGESINIISKQVMDTTRLQVTCSVSANDCYYLFLLNGAIVFDHRNGDVFSKLDFSCDYAWYDSDSDVLYLQNGNNISTWGEGEKALYKYLSPRIGLPESSWTYFKELIVTIDGEANITLFNQDEQVFSVVVGSGRHVLKAPYNTMGKYAQIQISGKGVLREVGLLYS